MSTEATREQPGEPTGTATNGHATEDEQPSTDHVRALELLEKWSKEDPKHDEEIWPKLKAALEEDRMESGARKLFDG